MALLTLDDFLASFEWAVLCLLFLLGLVHQGVAVCASILVVVMPLGTRVVITKEVMVDVVLD